MKDTFLQQLAFTCANCGNQQRFVPSASIQPCSGCRGTRWILGNDTKLFDWKQSLTVVRRTDRAQLAQIVRSEMLTLDSADAEPLVDALRQVKLAGWEAALDAQECGHPMALRSDDGKCTACVWDREMARKVQEQKQRADIFSAEIDTWMKKCSQAEADAKTLVRDVEGAVEELAESQNRVAELEKLVGLLKEQQEKKETQDGRVKALEDQLAASNREIEGLEAQISQVRREARDKLVAVLVQEDKVASGLKEAKLKLEEKNAQLQGRLGEILAERDDLQDKFDASVAHTIEMKRGYELMIEGAANAKIAVDDENKALRAELEQARRDYAAAKKLNDESWLGKDRVVEMDAAIKRLERELAAANGELERLRREAEKPPEKKPKKVGDSERELAAARKEIAALKKQINESWLNKDSVLALDREKKRLEHALTVANDSLAAATKVRDDYETLRQRAADLEQKTAKLESDLDAANRGAMALMKDRDEAAIYRDRAIEVEIQNERLLRDAEIAKGVADAATKERDAMALRMANTLEVERENEALVRERDEALETIRRLTKERDETAPYREHAIQLELEKGGLLRKVEVAAANIETLAGERDAALEIAAKVQPLEAEKRELERRLSAANAQLNSIREKLGVTA